MRGGAFLKGKEGRVGFRKKSFLAGETERLKKAFINKEGRDDYQVYLSSSQRLQPKDGETTTQIYLNSLKSPEVDDANAKILAAL